MKRPNAVLLFVSIAMLQWTGCGRDTTTVAPSTSSSSTNSPVVADSVPGEGTGVATFNIVEGDKTKTLTVTDVAEDETLESVMRRLEGIPITINGSGVTAFVDRIGEIGTDSSQGWTYTIDGEFANEGIGSTKLSPPVVIEWTFGSMRE